MTGLNQDQATPQEVHQSSTDHAELAEAPVTSSLPKDSYALFEHERWQADKNADS